MIILAIDPGTSQRNPAGLVVIDTDPQPRLLDHNTVWGANWQHTVRNVAIFAALACSRFGAQAIAYEYPFLSPDHGNAQTVIKLAHFGGVALAVAAACGIPAIEVYPAQAKQALTGDHQADKGAMVRQAKIIFGVKLTEHEADACGIALAGEAKLRQILLVGGAR